MRVSADHRRESSNRRDQVQLFYIVNHVQEFSRELYRLRLGQKPKVSMGVHISADGGDRRDSAKVFENLEIADIAGMKDVFHTL